ncbi:hypothetical protein BT63DRAFT_157416 [Microthyrium microscopicum]|uniref:Secreted protein n=1 Tax=Microthyrium microscopicum TaxID=703497 RepID=A0A6A6UNW7_9PEZI|nr:hypothetical protein BT63DRAFT_157416 [Microthyrium microscopicum]
MRTLSSLFVRGFSISQAAAFDCLCMCRPRYPGCPGMEQIYYLSVAKQMYYLFTSVVDQFTVSRLANSSLKVCLDAPTCFVSVHNIPCSVDPLVP